LDVYLVALDFIRTRRRHLHVSPVLWVSIKVYQVNQHVLTVLLVTTDQLLDFRFASTVLLENMEIQLRQLSVQIAPQEATLLLVKVFVRLVSQEGSVLTVPHFVRIVLLDTFLRILEVHIVSHVQWGLTLDRHFQLAWIVHQVYLLPARELRYARAAQEDFTQSIKVHRAQIVTVASFQDHQPRAVLSVQEEHSV
jgi:hypothetical protein